MKTDAEEFEELAGAVHAAERMAFHLDDVAYVEREKEVFDQLADGVVGYEHEPPRSRSTLARHGVRTADER